jgi:hypothetical protein
MKNDAERIALAGAQAAHAMAHCDPVGAAAAVDGPVMDRKDDSLALLQWYDLATRLCAWALFNEKELTAGEVLSRSTQQHGQL